MRTSSRPVSALKTIGDLWQGFAHGATMAIAALLLIVWSPVAHAFLGSEDEQFSADVKEAIARAKDFKRTMSVMGQEEEKRQSFSDEVRRERSVDAEAREIERRDFVRARNARPSEQDEEDRLERLEELKKEKEAEVMEANRSDYVAKRNRVRRLLERDGYIDEAREYGL